MMLNSKRLLLALVLTTCVAFLALAGDVGAYTGIDGGYVGSSTCKVCHLSYYNDFIKTGHPYKVRFTNGATPISATDPLSTLLIGVTPELSKLSTATLNGLKVGDGGTPDRLDWSAVEYVIGGYGWKARWGIRDTVNACPGAGCKTGYIWTGSGAQFNMLAADTTLDPTNARSDYSAYNSGTDKKYSCAICHNTNGTSSADANCSTALGSGRSEPWASSGLNSTNHGGFYSEWTFSGVQCEGCHGPGVTHANTAVLPSTNPNPIGVLTVGGEEVCAKCHIRSTNTPGFGGECGGDASASIRTGGAQNNGGNSLANQTVQHHEQFNELVGYNDDGAHASLGCSDCHDSHKRAHKVTDAIASALGIADNDQSAQDRGAVVSCDSCHPGKGLNYPMGDITCIDCHMAEITKSATAEVGAWGVKGDVKGHIFAINPDAATMDRTNAANVHIATNYMTVDFACGKCHDSSMSSFVGMALTRDQAVATALNIHNSRPTPKFKATNDAVTSLKVNFNAADTICPSGTCSYAWAYGQSGGTTTGDGTVTPSHTYTSTGTFNVTLTVNDTVNGTSASLTKPVMPINVMPTPTPTPSTCTLSGKVVRLDGTTIVGGATVRLYQGSTIKCNTSSNATTGLYSCTVPCATGYTVTTIKTGITGWTYETSPALQAWLSGSTVDISASRATLINKANR